MKRDFLEYLTQLLWHLLVEREKGNVSFDDNWRAEIDQAHEECEEILRESEDNGDNVI
mgnify:CR=1 FL=1